MNHLTLQSPDLLTAIVDFAGDAIASWGTDDRFTSWNPAAERLFGYAADEMIGQLTQVLVPPDLREECRDFLGRVAAAGSAMTLETIRQHKNGSMLEVEITVSPLSDPAGRLTGFSAIARDISERKANERKLRELEHRFHTFFEHMPGLTYIYVPQLRGANTGVLDVSQAFTALTGYPPEVWRTEEDFISTLVHPDDREWLRALNQATETTGRYDAELRIITKNGEVRWIRDQANLVYDEEGKPLYWLGFILDVSDQKQAEAATREAVAQLEAANLELERLSTAKSEFVSIISHELRTPLTSIQGFSELIANESLSPQETRQFAATINENARRLTRMIGNVLDLDRLESGKMELDRNYDTLNHLVEDVVASFQPTLSRHQLVSRLGDDLPLLWCDSDLIIRVITNLVANAIKYSPAGGTVTVSTQRCRRGVELTVADEGIGVPEDQREAIFSRYGRITRPEQRGIDGSGLGLPIARQIVGLHGGEIWVTANQPAGSIFHVVLPTEPPA